MNYSCLSSASILRCEGLSRVQSGIAFIPCALQIFILFLLLCFRASNRWKWLLIAESSSIFVLTLVDLLSHVLQEAESSLKIFKAFDIALASLSFLPVFIYSVILYGFAREQGFLILPRKSRIITHVIIVLFVLCILATNELGSFVGISRRVFTDQFGDPFLAIGFNNASDQTVWLLFTSIELALLLILQGFTFTYIFYLIVQGVQERRLGDESSPQEWSLIHCVKGNIWISIGVKLGVIEIILGFVQGGFAIVLARRVLRMLSRICIFAGVLDYGAEDKASSAISGNIHRRNLSTEQLRTMISAPRSSTFNRLSAGASNFYALPRARSNSRGFVPIMEEATPRLRKERVTVLYDQNGVAPPTLNLRLSDFDFPTPEAILQSSSRRRMDSRTDTNSRSRSSSNRIAFPSTQQTAERLPIGVALTTEQQQSYRRARSQSSLEFASQFRGSMPSLRSASLSLGRVLEQSAESAYAVAEFGNIAQGETSTTGATQSHSVSSSRSNSQKSARSSNSIKRKAVPALSPIVTSVPELPTQHSSPETLDSPNTLTSSAFDSARRPTTSAPTSAGFITEPSTGDTRSTGNPFEKFLYRESQLYNSGRGLGTIAKRVLEMGGQSTPPTAGSSRGMFSSVGPHAVEEEDPSSFEAVATASTIAESMSARSSYADSSQIQHGHRERISLGEALQRGGNVSRIKSIGVVSPRRTPTPSVGEHMRQSMKLLDDDMGDIPTSLPPSRASFQHSLAGSAASLMPDDTRSVVTTGRDGDEFPGYSRNESSGEWMV